MVVAAVEAVVGHDGEPLGLADADGPVRVLPAPGHQHQLAHVLQPPGAYNSPLIYST